MKVSKEQAQANRQRVVQTAARLFREQGYGGVGVADLMQAAGLTHGAFYGQFPSKQDLLAEATGHAIETTYSKLAEACAADPAHARAALAETYLCPEHRDHPGQGCVLAALGPELARQSSTVRAAVTDGVRRELAFLSAIMHGDSADEQRAGAIVTIASMVGALILARTVDDAALSDEFLNTVQAAIAGA